MTPDSLFRKIAEAALVECLAECEMNYKELLETVEQRIAEAVAAEREACAKIAEEIRQETEIDPDVPEFRRGFAAGWGDGCKEVLDAIRARSEGDSGDKNQ